MSEASLKWATSGQVPNSTISNTYGAGGNTLRSGEQMMGSGVETRIPVGQFSAPPSYGAPVGQATQPIRPQQGYMGLKPSGVSALPSSPIKLTNITSPQPSMSSQWSLGRGLSGEERFGNI